MSNVAVVSQSSQSDDDESGKSLHGIMQYEEIKEAAVESSQNSLAIQNEEFVYQSKIVLRTELQDDQLKNELAVKKMNYSQHEYVKINDVGQLITEAMQIVLDKINAKEKVIQSSKSQLRSQENKIKQLESQIVGFHKYGKELKSLHKNIKQVESNLDYNLAQHNHLVDKQLFQDTNILSEIKLLRSRMYDNEKHT